MAARTTRSLHYQILYCNIILESIYYCSCVIPTFDSIRKDPAFTQFMDELRVLWEGYKREFR